MRLVNLLSHSIVLLLYLFVSANFHPYSKWFGIKVCPLSLSNKVDEVKQVPPVVFFMHLLTDPANLSQKLRNHRVLSELKIHFIFLCTANNCALFKTKAGPLLGVKSAFDNLCVKYIVLN